jgi:uncharacterized protein
MESEYNLPLNRRHLTLGLAAVPWLLSTAARAHDSSAGGALAPVPAKLEPFAFNAVRLLDGPCRDAMKWNRRFMTQIDLDRLLHNFRVTAGLPSNAKPLGGWEAPYSEVRGHFVAFYLSACARMYAGDGDLELKARGDAIVACLAECQKALNQGGYLSAFPSSHFDRLDKGADVWAPFYMLHKIMTGLYDMHRMARNKQAMPVLLGMAGWIDRWTATKPREHMQAMLENEFGGMAEMFYDLAALTKDARWIKTGDRFAKEKFLAPLAARHDELKDRHANTHIPQVIAAARRYEVCGEDHDHTIADFFWNSVVDYRTYVTGGTGNKEFWLTEPHKLGAEWPQATTHAECCVAYNMMKLSRHLFEWSGDAKYMEYYERLLFNHRLGTIEPETGRSMYYLSLTPGAWKIVGNDDATFWCCTASGVEEYTKLGDTIYYHDRTGLYVNQYVASKLDWTERKIAVEQHTAFPEVGRTELVVKAAPGGVWPIHLRIPAWTKAPRVLINGQPHKAAAVPGSYLKIARAWKPGDRVVLEMPMPLKAVGFEDRPEVQALMVGPIVLAGQFPLNGATNNASEHNEPEKVAHIDKFPIAIPKLTLAGKNLAELMQPGATKLSYTLAGQSEPIELKPLYQSWQRYVVYWETA